MSCCCCLSLISQYILFIYPVFKTYKLVRENKVDIEEQNLWISYWIVFTILKVFELLTFNILFDVPFYFVIKSVFCLWLYHDSFQGINLINCFLEPGYKNIVINGKPIFAKFAPYI